MHYGAVLVFFLKKFIAGLLAPSVLAIFLVIAALVANRRRHPRLAFWLLISSVAMLYLTSIPLVSSALLRPLERAYAPLNEARVRGKANTVVVLGASYWPRREVPITGALNAEGVVRAVEGVRLFKALELQQLVLSGGAALGSAASARGYEILAKSLGVAPASMATLDQPRDTAQEAEAIHGLLGDTPFILVTSAYHMPRAMRLMKAAGMEPFPAPTGQRATDADGVGWWSFVPDGTSFKQTESALHEYLGLLALSVGLK